MASIIGVETLQHTNGTTAATIDSGGVVSLTDGSIGKIGTPVSVNGLSSTEYTGLPSDVSAIDISFSAVSNDTSNGFPGIVLGTSSGYETSNYFNNNPYMSSSSQFSGHNTNRSAFVLDSFGVAANSHYFHLRIVNHGSNNWIANGQGYTTSGPYNYWYMGHKTLSDTLTKVKIQVATGNFDAGTVNLNYYR